MRALAWFTGFSPLARRGGLMVLGGAGLAVLLVALPFLWLGGLKEQAATDKTQYDLIAARAQRLAGSGGVRLTAADEPARLFLPGETAGTTLAAFQSTVNAAAVRNGLAVMRMTPMPAEAAKGASAYRLSVDATGSIEQLRSFLADIESSLPLVAVTGFEIRPETAAGVGEQPYPSEALAVSLRLAAHGWDAAP